MIYVLLSVAKIGITIISYDDFADMSRKKSRKFKFPKTHRKFRHDSEFGRICGVKRRKPGFPGA
jgi:hypothetical protein